MTVIHQLARTATGWAQVQTELNIVESKLTELEENLTCNARVVLSALKHIPELALENAIGVLGLLLFSELD